MIESRQNKQIKDLFKLKNKKHRDITNTFLIFGDHGIEEAGKANKIVQTYTSNMNKKGVLISDKIMKELSSAESPFDIVAVVEKPNTKPFSNKVLILDGLQDPGNVGTLIRTAVGFGFKTIIKSSETVDFYNEKTVRATQGNLFYANLISANLVDIINELISNNYLIVATTMDSKTTIADIKNNEKIALILGNEGSGISQEVLNLTNNFVTINTNKIDSLNVMVAGSIIMYELRDIND